MKVKIGQVINWISRRLYDSLVRI